MRTTTLGWDGSPAAGGQREFGGGAPNAATIFTVFQKNNKF